MSALKRAVFLDRDGTLIRNHHYGCDPERIELLDGVVSGLRELQRAGYLLIVVTNQSGVARGYFDEAQLARMHRRLGEMLAEQGIQLTAAYHCPHHPDGVIPRYAIACECRKPRPGMVLRAAREHNVDLRACWLIGDILDDVEAGNSVGCRSILIDLGTEGAPETALRTPIYVARDFRDAASFILNAKPLERAMAGF